MTDARDSESLWQRTAAFGESVVASLHLLHQSRGVVAVGRWMEKDWSV